ncbi:MAG: hypothetical protein A3H49_02380 [Nitrospirae bacterium RIFCSPLOWO2_02_FULL_62_14]|nr:MAG: hypothetical protein A3H49_02380 [Nitrospirae bacterium RIFCSPLOWO2_02_FULL_62_14]OGW67036.1 MAG: hypothetical protein A3A88_03265 [Nitrospirae bacterium RIFCSPLOWO2_01_FULL_62_17]OGW88054.1 MAG: hypothetical protein A3K11_07000 [Nitrospirae bacterium RIFCSPLOWO2_12_FULL_63_8]
MEQLDSKRFRAHLPVAFARDGYSGEARGVVYNLSIEGCKVTSNTRVDLGTYLSLRLYLPGSPAPVEVRLAAVRWTMEWDFSVTFLHMQSEEIQRLNRYLAALETAHAVR